MFLNVVENLNLESAVIGKYRQFHKIQIMEIKFFYTNWLLTRIYPFLPLFQIHMKAPFFIISNDPIKEPVIVSMCYLMTFKETNTNGWNMRDPSSKFTYFPHWLKRTVYGHLAVSHLLSQFRCGLEGVYLTDPHWNPMSFPTFHIFQVKITLKKEKA